MEGGGAFDPEVVLGGRGGGGEVRGEGEDCIDIMFRRNSTIRRVI